MAKTAVKKPVKTTVKTGKDATKTTTSGMDDLSELAVAGRDLESEERAKEAGKQSFISLVTPRSGVLDKNNPAYMPGVKPFEYVIPSTKLRLGKIVDATILGLFKVYAEVTPKQKESDMAKTVKFWHPDDAVQFPIEGYFDRPLPNGNILQPVHWVCLYLHDNPDVTDGRISFRSVGNTFYKKLSDLVKAESNACTELRFNITYQELYNETYKKTDYYPAFEISGHNYQLTSEGKVVKTKDSKVDKATLREILERSKQAHEDYRNFRMVGKTNTQALLGSAPRKALPAGKGGYEEEEDENVNF